MKQKKIDLLRKAANLLNSSQILDELAAEMQTVLLKAEAEQNSARIMQEFNAVMDELTAVVIPAEPINKNELHPFIQDLLTNYFKPIS